MFENSEENITYILKHHMDDSKPHNTDLLNKVRGLSGAILAARQEIRANLNKSLDNYSMIKYFILPSVGKLSDYRNLKY